jgi:hypothetical protein
LVRRLRPSKTISLGGGVTRIVYDNSNENGFLFSNEKFNIHGALPPETSRLSVIVFGRLSKLLSLSNGSSGYSSERKRYNNR